MSNKLFSPRQDKTLLLVRHVKRMTDGTPITLIYYTDGTYHGCFWKPDQLSQWKIVNDMFCFKHTENIDFQVDANVQMAKDLARELKMAMAEREWLDE